MKSTRTGKDPVRFGSPKEELYFSSVDLAGVLELSDSEVAKLARSAVLVRQRDPRDSRAFVYPVWENVRRYIAHTRARKETAHVAFLEEKSRTQLTVRLRAELEMAQARGRLVDRLELFSCLAKALVAFKRAVLSRGSRLEQRLSQASDRKGRLAVIQADDADCLGLLDELLKTPGENGSNPGQAPAPEAQTFPL
jgi:hypothetical protein